MADFAALLLHAAAECKGELLRIMPTKVVNSLDLCEARTNEKACLRRMDGLPPQG